MVVDNPGDECDGPNNLVATIRSWLLQVISFPISVWSHGDIDSSHVV